MSSTPPGGSRSPTYGSSASLRSSPTSRSLSIISGSTSMRSAVPANHRILAPLMLEPKLLVAMSSSWWASSMTTMSCSGSIPCSARISVASRWVFTTMTSAAFARSLAISAKQLSPLGHLLRPGHSLLVTLTALQLAGLGFEVELGSVTGRGRVAELDKFLDLVFVVCAGASKRELCIV